MSNLAIGDSALPFDLPGVDGQTYSLGSLSRGRQATAVVFMCNHCPYVLAWLDRLNAIAQEYAGRDVAFAGINANDAAKYPADSFQAMQALSEERGLSFPYLHDETQEVARAYGAVRTPEIFLFDRDLRLRYHGAPDSSYDDAATAEPYLRQALDHILAGGRPAIAETPPVGCTIKWKQG